LTNRTATNYKIFCTSKEKIYQDEETTHRIGENVCLLFFKERINIQNIQSSKKINTKRTDNPINGEIN
jgi:hypothetical protein